MEIWSFLAPATCEHSSRPLTGYKANKPDRGKPAAAITIAPCQAQKSPARHSLQFYLEARAPVNTSKSKH